MTGLSLYDLCDEARALDDLVGMDDGEWSAEHEALHTPLMEALVAKADGFGSYVRDLEQRVEVIKIEEERLAARRKRLESRVKWMKEYAVTALLLADRKKLEGTLFTLAVQKNPDSVAVSVLPDALPPEYVRVIPEVREPDKKGLLSALEAGVAIPGVELAPPTYHLRIR
ncbi:MAG: siphovirus Gp157 family protein [Gemmatimonadaceae bacterium]|nr:siphovirus Gp157 family protein [Gemmatimonadaceae bacterium]